MTDNGSYTSDVDDAITSAIGPMLAELRSCMYLPDTDPRRIAAIAEKRRLLDIIEAEPTGRVYRDGFRTECVTPRNQYGDLDLTVFTVTCIGCEEFFEYSTNPAKRGGVGQEAATEWVMSHRCR